MEWLQQTVAFVGLTAPDIRRLETAALDAGATVVRMHLAAVVDRDALIETMSTALEIPNPSGLNAAIDDFADRLLLENSDGYVWLVDGLDELLARAPRVFDDAVSVLPSIADRWSGPPPIPFVVSVDVSESIRRRVLDILEAENQERVQAEIRYAWVKAPRLRVAETLTAADLPWPPPTESRRARSFE